MDRQFQKPIDLGPRRPVENKTPSTGLLLVLIFVTFLMGLLIGDALDVTEDLMKYKKYVTVVPDEPKRTVVARPQTYEPKVSIDEMRLALNAVRFAISPLNEKIENMESERNHDTRELNLMINKYKTSPESETCRSYRENIERLEKEINTEKVNVQKLIILQDSLRNVIYRIRNEGYNDSVNRDADKVYGEAKQILHAAKVDLKAMDIMEENEQDVISSDDIDSHITLPVVKKKPKPKKVFAERPTYQPTQARIADDFEPLKPTVEPPPAAD